MSQSGASPQLDLASYRTIVEKLQALENHRQATSKELASLRNEVGQVLVLQGSIAEKIGLLVGNGTTDLEPIVPKLIREVADLKDFKLVSEPILEDFPATKKRIDAIFFGASILGAVLGAVGTGTIALLKFFGVEIIPHIKKG